MFRQVFAAACVVIAAVALSGANAYAKEDYHMKREVINFNTDWLYSDKDYTNANLYEFDDSAFEEVSIPHANTILTKHKGPDFQSQIESYRFVSWYRRRFSLPECYNSGDRVIVEFEGVATVADIYVNGAFIGRHKGAYTGFSYDITDYVKSENNVLAVRVDSTKHTDIPPEGNRVDYCLFGGIVRDVNMIVTGSAYVENTFITTSDLKESDGKSALLNSMAAVVNKGGTDKEYHIETLVIDAEGNTFAKSVSEPKTVKSNETLTFNSAVKVEDPRLWDGLNDPYLYTVITRVMDGDKCVDDYSTDFGFRWFEFKDDGLCLNGKTFKLMGINRHEQWPWIGRAVVNKYQAKDADLIAETGFNAVRCSHYPQDPSFLKRCDELGLVVFEEAPGWQHIGDDSWKELYIENITDMIIRDRNHPSIISWGVRVNESDDDNELYARTNALARSLDPTRPTHGARRQDSYQGSTFYEDIYTAHYIYPEVPVHTPFLVTEHSWDCWSNGYGNSWASDEQALAFTRDFADKVNYYFGNKLCAGGFAWSMFDYDNEVNYTNTGNVFYSGMYDIFRLPKMASNLYISQKDPQKYGANIYIANYWDDNEKPLSVNSVSGDIAQGGNAGGGVIVGDKFSVTVMSNCDSVELYVNGVKSDVAAVRQYTNLPHPFFTFEGVEYVSGEITAVGYIDGKEAARYTQKTPGKPSKLVLKPDYEAITADGSDLTSVTISALDENGSLVPNAANTVYITVDGCGKFIGEQEISLEGGRSAFLVQSQYLKTGTIRCTVASEGMEAAECEIEVLPFEGEIVPVSEREAGVTPIEISYVNDSETGSSLNTFTYTGNWLTTYQNGCFDNDNYYSNSAGDVCVVEFVGTNITWHGSVAPNHGIMAVSVDGGEETFIDCYSPSRKDRQELFNSGKLNFGIHTLKVRVTGDKNPSASDYYINADFVGIVNDSGKSVSEIKYSFIDDAVHSDGNINYGSVTEWQINTAPQYFYIDTIDFDKLNSVLLRFGYQNGDAVLSIYAYDNGGEPVTEEQLKGFCADPSALGESIGEIANSKKSDWGYQAVRITSNKILQKEGSDRFNVLDSSKILTVPQGTGTKALIVGIDGSIGSWGYFDNLSLVIDNETVKKVSIKSAVVSNGTLSFELEASNIPQADIYTALYDKDNRLVGAVKNALNGEFKVESDKEYTLKVFVWAEGTMKPVLSSASKTVVSE